MLNIFELYIPYLTGIVSYPFSLSSMMSFESTKLLDPNILKKAGK